jgi:hypothetical protein
MPLLDLDMYSKLASMSGSSQEDRLTLENKALTNEKLKRELSEPSTAELAVYDKKVEAQKFIFNQIKEIATNTTTSQAVRDNLYSQLESNYYTLPDDMKSILVPILKNTPLDENQKKLDFFEKQYGKGPEVPMGSWGNGSKESPYTIAPLPVDETTERNWAEYQLKKADYEYTKKVFILGKEAAAMLEKPSEFIKVLTDQPAQKEGGQAVAASYWRINRNTNVVERVSEPFANADIELAKKWGYSEQYMLQNNFVPTKEPFTGTYQGQSFKVTTGTDRDGAPKNDIQTYGSTEIKDKETLQPFLNAFGHAAAGTKVEKISDGFEKTIVMKLNELKDKNLDKTSFRTALGNLTKWAKSTVPNFNYEFAYFESNNEHPFMRSNLIEIDGSNWGLIPATETITYADGTSLYYDNVSGKYSDAQGQDVTTEAKGTKSGDELPAELTVATPKTTENKTLGDVISAIAKKVKTGPDQGTQFDQLNKQLFKTDASGEAIYVDTESAKRALAFAKDVLGFTAEQLNAYYNALNNALIKLGQAPLNIPIPGTRK